MLSDNSHFKWYIIPLLAVVVFAAIFLGGCKPNEAPSTSAEATSAVVEATSALAEATSTPVAPTPVAPTPEAVSSEVVSSTPHILEAVSSVPHILEAVSSTPTPQSSTEDLIYTYRIQGAVVEQKLDIYKPSTGTDLPVVIIAHGSSQHKEDFAALGKEIADSGAVVFVVDWPVKLSESALRNNGQGLRESTDTLLCAVRFAVDYAPLHGGDPETIIFVGFSAGAGAGAITSLGADALSKAWSSLEAEQDIPVQQVGCTVHNKSSRVDAFIGIGGPYNLYASLAAAQPDLWQVISPASYFSSSADVLVRLLHSPTDAATSLEGALAFRNDLTDAGFNADLVEYDGGHIVPHDLTLNTISDLLKLLGK